MGRNEGVSGEHLDEDIKSGRWRNQVYEVRRDGPRPNRNWFAIAEFVDRVQKSEADARPRHGLSFVDAPIPIPPPGSPWYPDLVEFALTYHGYARHGASETVAIGNGTVQSWREGRTLPDDIDILRCALFYEQRRWRHLDQEPTGETRDYVDALLERLVVLTGGTVPGPPDPVP